MFGVGFAAGHRPAARPPAPARAPGYVPALSTPLHAAYGAQRAIAGYAGPLFQLRRSSDGALLDVSPQGGGDYPNYAALARWAGAATLTVAALYDQSGNGRHLTQPVAANQPVFDLAVTEGGRVPISFDGYARSTDAAPLNWRNKYLSGAVALDRIAHTVLIAGIPINSQNSSGFAQLLNGGSSILGIVISGLTMGTLAGAPRTSRTVWGYGKNATGNQWRADGRTVFQSSGATGQAINQLVLGSSNVTASAGQVGVYKMFAVAVYAAGLSAADGDNVANGLLTAIDATSTYDYRLVWDGDSIQEGTGATQLRSVPQLVQARLAKRFDGFTTAVHGQQLATIYANRAARFAPIFAAGRPNVIFLQAGINDIAAGTTGANLHNNSLGPLVSYLKGLGYRVIVSTLLPFNGNANWSAAKDAERAAYNALVVANGAGAHQVLDIAQHPVMGASTAPGDTTLYADALHPTALGYQWLAGAPSGTFAGPYTYYAALREALRGATGDASFVP